MVYIWGAVLFIFLFTIPTQEKKEDKVWRELEESVIQKEEKKEEKKEKKERLRIGDVFK